MHTIEHKTTPIKNVADIIALIDRWGPFFFLGKFKLFNNLFS